LINDKWISVIDGKESKQPCDEILSGKLSFDLENDKVTYVARRGINIYSVEENF
jgi:hypothetical protein